MKSLLKILVAAGVLAVPVFLLGGCETAAPDGGDSGKEQPGPDGGRTDDDPAESEFVLTMRDFPSKVDVTLDGTALYTVTLSYDGYGRLASCRRESADCVLEDAAISHKSNTEASVVYRQAGSVSSALSVRISSGRLVWSYSDINNGNRYSVLLDSGRWPSQYGYNVQFSGKKYSNLIAYGSGYTYSDGNLVTTENASSSTSAASVKTVCASAPDCADNLTYSDKADCANLGAFLLAGEFLPWYMKGLPGNKRLVSRIGHSAGGRTLDEYEELEYGETDGKTTEMRVFYYGGGSLLHTKEYKITY